MAHKVLRRNISYNKACSILEANHYNIARTKSFIKAGMIIFIDNMGRTVARYTERLGRLEVICN